MMSAKNIVFSLMCFTATPSVSGNAACSEPESFSGEAEPTSGECLMQSTLLKSKVQVEGIQEDAATDESESQVDDESAEDVVNEEDEQYDQIDADDVPKCKAKEDCKGEGQDCVNDICINGGSLQYKWTLATVNYKCDGGAVGKPIVKGKPEIMDCKKECQKRPGCTGFNRGKKGNWEAKCWFFKKCTKDTPQGQLTKNMDFNVYFVSATAEVDVPSVTIVKKNMKILGLTQVNMTQEAAQEDEQEAVQVQEDGQEAA